MRRYAGRYASRLKKLEMAINQRGKGVSPTPFISPRPTLKELLENPSLFDDPRNFPRVKDGRPTLREVLGWGGDVA